MKNFSNYGDGFVFNTSRQKRPLQVHNSDYGNVEFMIPVELIVLEDGAQSKDNPKSIIIVNHHPNIDYCVFSEISLKMLNEGLKKIGFTIKELRNGKK